MRFIVDKEELIKGLTMVSKAVPQKVELPILANIKLELTNKGLEIVGSDNNLTIKTVVPYMIGDREIIREGRPGAALIGLKIFAEVIRHLEGADVSIELIDNSILRVDDGHSNYKLNSVSAEEYPEIDLDILGAFFEVKAKDFIGLVEQTAFAASMKETRPILTTVNLECANRQLTATATDTARLARKTIEIENDVRFTANIPAKKLLDIVHSFEGDTMVSVSVSDKKALFKFDNTVISTRLTNGDYPNTKNIVPKTFNYYLEVNSRELLGAMERVSLLSADRDGVIKLLMSEDGIEVISRSSMVGSANEKINTYQFNGERFEISFRASFVADAIKAVKCEDVEIAFIGEMKPFVVKNPKDDTIDMLITPLRS